MPRHGLAADRSGAISIMFATMIIPLLLIVGLAIDFGFYVRAQAQLNLAADSAAMHAVRAAALAAQNGAPSNTGQNGTTSSGNTNWNYAGVRAGQEWFTSQATLVKGFTSSTSATTESSTQSTSQTLMGVTVTITYIAGTFTATVSYSGTMNTIFGKLAGVRIWPIAGSATSAIDNKYVEVLMLLDNSSSMLIGATVGNMAKLEHATECSALNTAGIDGYTWQFTGQTAQGNYYGYGNAVSATYANPHSIPTPTKPAPVPPTLASNNGSIFNFAGDPSVGYNPVNDPNVSPTTGFCINGGGNTNSYFPGNTHVPQAPCAFACHSSSSGNDFYALARTLTDSDPTYTDPKGGHQLRLRLDVVQNAALQVLQTMAADQQAPGQLLAGVYEFNSTLSQVYPTSGEAASDFTTAESVVSNIPTPVTAASDGNTYFNTIATQLASQVMPAGAGNTPANAIKNIFIVTDGLENDGAPSNTSPFSPSACQNFKDKGFNVYVLYTQYLPIPHYAYIVFSKPYAEPATTSPIVQALQACATAASGNKTYYFQASSATDIATAMQTMLAQALEQPAQVTN